MNKPHLKLEDYFPKLDEQGKPAVDFGALLGQEINAAIFVRGQPSGDSTILKELAANCGIVIREGKPPCA